MSKWINKEKFEKFKNERESDTVPEIGGNNFARKYPSPKMGTASKPNEYHVRLLPDTNGDFYKKMHFHMFRSGEKWNFILCPKTFSMDNYCPWCALTQILYQGSESDKKRAYNYKRKDKFVGNVFVVNDPRDAGINDEEKKLGGKTFLYEFPQTIETLIKKEITDTENGWGYDIFEPEKGYNFIISIGAKKPDKDGKVWPDYSLTTFAKRPSSIADTEGEVDEIMSSTQSLSDYLNKSSLTPEQHKELLMSEMVYEDVEDGFIRHMMKSSEVSEGKTEEKKKEKKEKVSKPAAPSDSSDEDLLNELAGI